MLSAAEEAGLFGTGQTQQDSVGRRDWPAGTPRSPEKALVLLHVLLSPEQMADFGRFRKRWKRTKIEAALEL
jgi:hypothetical protein